jgi:preprotein translocase subunit YajC
MGAMFFGLILPLVLMFGIFYLLLIRPQKKQQNNHILMLSKLQVGDKVETTAGIIASVNEINEDDSVVIITEGSKMKIKKQAVVRILD